jgi:hypothetical protein
MDELRDFVSKLYKNTLKKGHLSCILRNNKLGSNFDICELLFVGWNFYVNCVV